MIGSTAAGASAAGTVGIIGGTGSGAGAVAAVVSAPATIIASLVAAIGLGAMEAGCYFTDERITDYGQVLSLLEKIALDSDPMEFQLVRNVSGPAYIYINYDGTGLTKFFIKDLYIVNGELMNRDWFGNTSIGNIAVAVAATK